MPSRVPYLLYLKRERISCSETKSEMWTCCPHHHLCHGKFGQYLLRDLLAKFLKSEQRIVVSEKILN